MEYLASFVYNMTQVHRRRLKSGLYINSKTSNLYIYSQFRLLSNCNNSTMDLPIATSKKIIISA